HRAERRRAAPRPRCAPRLPQRLRSRRGRRSPDDQGPDREAAPRRGVIARAVVVMAAALVVAVARGDVPTPPFSPSDEPVQQAQVLSGRRPTTGRYEYVVTRGMLY